MKAKIEKLSRKAHELKKSRAGHEEWEIRKRFKRKGQMWVWEDQTMQKGTWVKI
jgi:hypothetical protein